jgi:hypothetical protein
MITTTVIAILLQLSIQNSQDVIFKKAVLDKSTEPYFVLITVINDSTNSNSLITTEAPFLLGAIHIEHSIPYSENGSAEVERLALAASNRIFRFKKPNALKNIGHFYNDQILGEIKKKIGDLSREELISQVADSKSALHKIYQERTKITYIPYRNAIAHILLENGIAVRRNSKSGNLYSE